MKDASRELDQGVLGEFGQHGTGAPSSSARSAAAVRRAAGLRPTIGFVVDSLVDAYEESIWEGVVAEAEVIDANLLCYVGGRFGDKYHPFIYDLIRRDQVDVLLAISSSLGCLLPPGGLEAEYRRFAPIPIVSIGQELGGGPSLLVDNRSGVRELLSHLIQVHGRRRIAFIRGPVSNWEAEQRFEAYRAALEEHGLAYDPERVYVGDFDRSAGVRAVQAFLDERRIAIDALVGANDYMAIYAMKELQRRGIRVPEDVSVGGFDDIRDATSVEPLLSTVRQPLQELGRYAVRQGVATARGEPVPACSSYPTQVVIRRSCGCILPARARPDPPAGALGSLEARLDRSAISARLQQLFPELAERLELPSWAEGLSVAMVQDLDRGSNELLGALDQLVVRGLARGVETSAWYPVVRAALELARRAGAGSDLEAVANLFQKAMELVAYRSEQAQVVMRVREREEFEILQRFASTFQLEDDTMRQVLATELPNLGIRSFFLSRYLDDSRTEAALFFHMGAGAHLVLDDQVDRFPSARLVPGRFRTDQRHAHAVLPIHAGSRTEPWGFVLCELSRIQVVVYEMLFTQIGTALRVNGLISRVRQHASELETRVEQRTRELRDAQEQIMDAARRAGMAEIAIGLMHNVGNLLNSVNVSAARIGEVAEGSRIDGLAKLHDLLRSQQADLPGFFARDPRAGLVCQYLGKIAGELQDVRGNIQQEAKELLDRISLIRDTITTLQAYAREGRDALPSSPLDVGVVLDTALRLQDGKLTRAGVEVIRDLAPVPTVLADRAELVHVFVNLIKNSVEAMRDTPPGQRRLTVQVRAEEGCIRIRLTDAGEGISAENLPRIFSYGFTTKEDGHGFGLHTCANHVRHLGGTITAESDGPKRGATFVVSFPMGDEGGAGLAAAAEPAQGG